MALSLTEGRAGRCRTSCSLWLKTQSNSLPDFPYLVTSLRSRIGRFLFTLHTTNHLFSTLAVSARSIATVTTFPGLSSFTIVVTDVDGETAVDGGGISSLLLDSARSSTVEKLLNVDLSRFEDGDMLMHAAQPARSFKVRENARSPQNARFLVLIRRRPFGP
jgi:hypothetical protein